MPPSPLTIWTTGFVVSGSSSGGRSPRRSGSAARRPRRARGCAPAPPTSSRSAGRRDFAIVRTRSRRFSTWSRSATTSSSSIVSHVVVRIRVRRRSRASTATSASAFRSSPRTAALKPGGSTSPTVAGVVLAELSTSAIGSSRSSGIGAIPTAPCRTRSRGTTPVSAVKSVVFPSPGRPTIPTSSGIAQTLLRADELSLERRERAVLERLHGAFALSEDPGVSAFAKPKQNLSVSTWRCSDDSRSIISQHPDLADRVERLRPRPTTPCPSLGHVVLGLARRRPARKWSIARLCAIRKSQAENGADCQRKRPIDSSIRRNVCVVRSSASCRLPTLTCR